MNKKTILTIIILIILLVLSIFLIKENPFTNTKSDPENSNSQAVVSINIEENGFSSPSSQDKEKTQNS